MATMTIDDREIKLNWLTADVIKNAIRESEEHPTRIAFLEQLKRCWKYYLTTINSYIPNGDTDELVDNNTYPIASENRIKKSVNDAISILLKNNPIVRHYPHANKPGDGGLADQMDEMLAAVWRPDGGNMGNLIQTTLLEAIISGLGVSKVFWDASNQLMDDGQVAGDKIPHKDLFLDPYATNDKRGIDCRYIIHRTWHTEAYVKERFGYNGEGKKVKGTSGLGWSRFANYIKESLNKPLSGGGSEDPYDQYDPRIAVYEAWLFPATTKDGDLATGKTIEERDFPYGVVATMVQDTIINVRPSPNASEKELAEEPSQQDTNAGIEPAPKNRILGSKRHPFALMYWQPTADSDGHNRIYCTQGAVANMISAQVSYNSISTNIHINASSFANPAKIVVEGAMKNLPSDRIIHEPGAIYTENDRFAGRGIRNLEGSQLPAYVMDLRNVKREAISELGGVNMLMTGVGTIGTSHMPGSTLQGLQEASFAPLYTPVQELSRGIYDMAILIEGLMQQHYEVGRFVEVSDKGERRFIEWKDANILASFARVVVSGSTTPMDDIGREQSAAEITAAVNAALQTGDKYLLISTILYLKNLNKAYAYDWIQLLQKKIAEIDQIQEEMKEVGMAQAGQQMQASMQQGMPAEGDMPEGEGDMESVMAELQNVLEQGAG